MEKEKEKCVSNAHRILLPQHHGLFKCDSNPIINDRKDPKLLLLFFIAFIEAWSIRLGIEINQLMYYLKFYRRAIWCCLCELRRVTCDRLGLFVRSQQVFIFQLFHQVHHIANPPSSGYIEREVNMHARTNVNVNPRLANTNQWRFEAQMSAPQAKIGSYTKRMREKAEKQYPLRIHSLYSIFTVV